MSIKYNYEHSISQVSDIGLWAAEQAWREVVQMVEQKYHCCKLSPRVEFRVEDESTGYHTVYQFQVELPDRRMSTIFDLEVIPQLRQEIENQRRRVAVLRDMHQSISTSLAVQINEEIENSVRDSFK